MTVAPTSGRTRRHGALLCAVAVVAFLVPTATSAAPTEGLHAGIVEDAAPAGAGVSVEGNRWFRDGEPWLPRGFNMIGLLTPEWCGRAVGIDAREHFGAAELAAARDWGADTLRFQVSQRGLADPDVADADRAAYLAHVLDGIALARAEGFVVIVSVQDQFYGCGDVHPLPSAATVDAWSALVPPLKDDASVLFELFNEPRNENDAAGWAQWRDGGPSPDANLGDIAVGHQALVDHVRALDATNVLVVDTARLGERSTGLPLLSDPRGLLAYGIHPYYFQLGPSWWDEHYGDLAAVAPVIATEWNYRADGCSTAKEDRAPDLLDYLRRHGIGVLGHAFDALRTTVADWSWTPTECGTAAGGSGALLRSFFLSLPGTDTAPPATPTGLQASATEDGAVELTWDPDGDATKYLVLRDGADPATATGSPWRDPDVEPSTSYEYTVRALDAAGNVSGNAVAVVVSTPGPPPDTTPPTAPATLDVRVLAPGSVRLGWSPVTDDVGVTG